MNSIGLFFFFKQKTAYEVRSSDWSSDVCSSDLWLSGRRERRWTKCWVFSPMRPALPGSFCIWRTDARPSSEEEGASISEPLLPQAYNEIGRASCGERVCQSV